MPDEQPQVTIDPETGSTPSVPPFTPITSAPIQPKKSKKPLILIGLIVLAAISALLYWFVLRDNKKAPDTIAKKASDSSQSQTASAPLTTALQKVAAANTDSTTNYKDDSYYFMVNDQTYSTDKGTFKGHYNMGDSVFDRNANSSAKACATNSNRSTVQPKLDAAAKIFTDAGFTATKGVFESYQQINCAVGYNVADATDSCSLLMDLSSAVTAGKSQNIWEMSIACLSTDTAKADLTKSTAFLEVTRDVYNNGLSGRVVNFNPLPDYVKDSATSGYKIAQTDSVASGKIRYYKVGTAKWQVLTLKIGDVNDATQFGLCTSYAANPELAAAFKGESCTKDDKTSSIGTI